jgi:serine-type D-Ala-D-Ala carboxypeptidase (penicillin-binding protein 5/6)
VDRSSALRRAGWAVVAFLVPALVLVVVPGLAGAQIGTSAPPPTPVLLPNGRTSMSPFPSVLRTPASPLPPPRILAPAAILADLESGQVLFERGADRRRPIASVTKIVTALLVLERTDPQEIVTVSARASGDGRTAGISELGLVTGERIRVDDLLAALMLQSANDAAIALAEHVSGTVEAFVKDMNARVRHLGLRDSRFTSPNGLDDRGYSTARDLVAITRAAYAEAGFASIVATRSREIPAPGDLPSRVVQNRNALLWLYPGAVGVKTGFTSRAGACIVAVAERGGLRLVAVVLGASGEAFSSAAALLDHGFAAFERREVVAEGEDLGEVRIDGREVPVASSGSLVALIPTDADVTRRRVLDPHAAFPPLPGEVVGTLRVEVPDLRIGDVDLVVTDVPPPPPPGSGPWWVRAGSAVADALGVVVDGLFG